MTAAAWEKERVGGGKETAISQSCKGKRKEKGVQERKKKFSLL